MKAAKNSGDYLKCLTIEATKQKVLNTNEHLHNLNFYNVVHPEGKEIRVLEAEEKNPELKIFHTIMKNNRSYVPDSHRQWQPK